MMDTRQRNPLCSISRINLENSIAGICNHPLRKNIWLMKSGVNQWDDNQMWRWALSHLKNRDSLMTSLLPKMFPFDVCSCRRLPQKNAGPLVAPRACPTWWGKREWSLLWCVNAHTNHISPNPSHVGAVTPLWATLGYKHMTYMTVSVGGHVVSRQWGYKRTSLLLANVHQHSNPIP